MSVFTFRIHLFQATVSGLHLRPNSLVATFIWQMGVGVGVAVVYIGVEACYFFVEIVLGKIKLHWPI